MTVRELKEIASLEQIIIISTDNRVRFTYNYYVENFGDKIDTMKISHLIAHNDTLYCYVCENLELNKKTENNIDNAIAFKTKPTREDIQALEKSLQSILREYICNNLNIANYEEVQKNNCADCKWSNSDYLHEKVPKCYILRGKQIETIEDCPLKDDVQ